MSAWTPEEAYAHIGSEFRRNQPLSEIRKTVVYRLSFITDRGVLARFESPTPIPLPSKGDRTALYGVGLKVVEVVTTYGVEGDDSASAPVIGTTVLVKYQVE